jgi:hypothetical protein
MMKGMDNETLDAGFELRDVEVDQQSDLFQTSRSSNCGI